MSEYSQKLKDPRWQKKRLQIFERDKWCCQQCMETTKTLHVHHLDYLPATEPWEYDDSFLITLCEDCHSEITETLPLIERKLMTELRLALKFPLFFEFATTVIKEYDKDLLYLLFETKDQKEQVIEFLQKIFNSNKK